MNPGPGFPPTAFRNAHSRGVDPSAAHETFWDSNPLSPTRPRPRALNREPHRAELVGCGKLRRKVGGSLRKRSLRFVAMQGEPETPINRKSKPKFEVRKKPKHGLHFALQANTPMNANGKLQVIFLLALLLHSARPPPPPSKKKTTNSVFRVQGATLMKPCKSRFCTLIAPLSRPPQSPYVTVKQNPPRNPGEGL